MAGHMIRMYCPVSTLSVPISMSAALHAKQTWSIKSLQSVVGHNFFTSSETVDWFSSLTVTKKRKTVHLWLTNQTQSCSKMLSRMKKQPLFIGIQLLHQGPANIYNEPWRCFKNDLKNIQRGSFWSVCAKIYHELCMAKVLSIVLASVGLGSYFLT